MSTQHDVESLIAAAKALPEAAQRRLLAALQHAEPTSARRITELRGLGKELWQCTDAQEYVDAERASWPV